MTDDLCTHSKDIRYHDTERSLIFLYEFKDGKSGTYLFSNIYVCSRVELADHYFVCMKENFTTPQEKIWDKLT